MTETSAPMTRREIEDARAHLKAWFQNQSVERHTFNKLCDQAVRAISPFGYVEVTQDPPPLAPSPEAMALLRVWLERLDYSDPHGDKPKVKAFLERYEPQVHDGDGNG